MELKKLLYGFYWKFAVTMLMTSASIQCQDRPSRSIGNIAKLLFGTRSMDHSISYHSPQPISGSSVNDYDYVVHHPMIIYKERPSPSLQPIIQHYQQNHPLVYQPYIFLAQPHYSIPNTPLINNTIQNTTKVEPTPILQKVPVSVQSPHLHQHPQLSIIKMVPPLPFNNQYYPPPWTRYNDLNNYFTFPTSQIQQIQPNLKIQPSKQSLRIKKIKRLRSHKIKSQINQLKVSVPSQIPIPISNQSQSQNSSFIPTSIQTATIQTSPIKPIVDYIIVNHMKPVAIETIYPAESIVEKMSSYFKSLMSNMKWMRRTPDSYLNLNSHSLLKQNLDGGRRSFDI